MKLLSFYWIVYLSFSVYKSPESLSRKTSRRERKTAERHSVLQCKEKIQKESTFGRQSFDFMSWKDITNDSKEKKYQN